MFMGKIQILEFGLKGLLFRLYSVPLESMEKWTLGQVKNKLCEKGLRKDFLSLLESLLEYRNYMAHEFMSDNAIVGSIVEFSPRKQFGELFRATFQLEQLIIIYDLFEEHKAWE
ncbi:MAG: hypothetical protein H6625_11675 [Bdellovibrionaceae bacterium]|nr:hypothetical protein [Pseudobdellovibrionaceae bacterium]